MPPRPVKRLSPTKTPLPQVGTAVERYRLHVQKWKDGCGATICERANRLVFAKGTLPCDVLFVGEAPGSSEDVIGKPFMGPAGRLLDQILATAMAGLAWPDGRRVATAFTNLVCCMPKTDRGQKAGEPEWEDIDLCRPRLEEMVEIASPKLIVAVGKLSKEYLEPGFKHSVKYVRGTPLEHVDHPAYILRQNAIQLGILAQRAAVRIQNAVETMIEEHSKSA